MRNAKSVAVWISRALLAVMFLAAAGMKLLGQPMMVAEFDKLGFGQWFRVFTAAIELIGALVLLAPRYSALGAMLLLVVDIGAFVAQVTVLHGGWFHTIVIGAPLAVLSYL